MIDLKYVHIAPTYNCNLHCSYCYAEKFKTKFKPMTWKKYIGILDILVNNNIAKIGLIGGEPTLWGYIDKAIGAARNLGINVTLFTNCLKLPKTMPDGVFVNGNNLLDDKHRDAIIKNLEIYRENKVLIGLRFNLSVNDTAKTLNQYAAWSKKYADYVSVTPALPYSLNKKLGKILYDFCCLVAANKQKINSARAIPLCLFSKKQLKFMRDRVKLYSKCHPGGSRLTINADGKIMPCVSLSLFRNIINGDLNKSKELFGPTIKKLKRIKSFEQCGGCDYFPEVCQGGCLTERLAEKYAIGEK